MASIEEILGTLAQAQTAMTNAVAAAAGANQKAGQLQAQLAALGVRDKAAALNVAKGEIDKYRAYLAGGTELANAAVNAVKAVGG
ncbi:hypothetical protein Val02_27000 [Virgisporangium aliadipatigenens]|uniref:Uncharacterized protein n=1 Tax=Virgisporangium aliadipatigenens TaxID=741659 RepID=A0A8J3YID1_9ACTN|nr:hypothetical protein [Virgisporangium aliadipatigenens]GIJ45814.1 hypothetical protein Val02_27000 [Virgisporangium aliadipatigenens]